MDMSHTLKFRKSSYSSGGHENCVEVADFDSGSAVRDTQNRDAGHLAFDRAEWAALVVVTRR